MSIQDRKKREKIEMRNLIIGAVNHIIDEEGIDNLSIRKIANIIEYSPAIIYHYFKDKNEIVNCIMKTGYEKILSVLATAQDSDINPEEKLEKTLREYIKAALEMQEEYKTIMLSSSKEVLDHTAVLLKGTVNKRQALNILYQCIKNILNNQDIKDTEVELTAQIVWTSTFGLIMRVIIEKETPENQQELLIEHHIKFMLNGILLLKRGNE